MEYKRTEPIHGKLNGRHVTFYQYEFPRATRDKGKFLPKGTVRIREFLFCDGRHEQLVQLILIAPDELERGNEKRVLVDKMLDINREDKMFKEGTLTSRDLSGEIREYSGKTLICISDILTEQEKIGLFASARRIKDSRRRQRRARHWKLRIQIAVAVALFVLGLASGGIMQKYGFFDLHDNAFYQNHVLPLIYTMKEIIKDLSH